MRPGKWARCADSKETSRLRCFCLGGLLGPLHPIQHIVDLTEIGAPRFGEGNRLGRALQQPCANALFQP